MSRNITTIRVRLGQLVDGFPNCLARFFAHHGHVRRLGPRRESLGMVPVALERRQQIVERFLRMTPPRSQFAQRRIHGNAMQPCGQSRRRVELFSRAKCRDKGFLHGVLRFALVAQNPARHRQQLGTLLPDDLFKRLGLPVDEPPNEPRLVVEGHRAWGFEHLS